MPLTALLELHLTPDDLEHAFEVLAQILTDTRNFPGCDGVEILVDTTDPAHVVVQELWTSVEADAAYRLWRTGDGATDLGSVLVSPPVLTVLTTWTHW